METEMYIPSAKKIGPLLWGLLPEDQKDMEPHRDRWGSLSSSPQIVAYLHVAVGGDAYNVTITHVTNSGMCINAGFNFGFQHAGNWSSLPIVTVQMANDGTRPMFTNGSGTPLTIAHKHQWSRIFRDNFEVARQLAMKIENADYIEIVKQQEA